MYYFSHKLYLLPGILKCIITKEQINFPDMYKKFMIDVCHFYIPFIMLHSVVTYRDLYSLSGCVCNDLDTITVVVNYNKLSASF